MGAARSLEELLAARTVWRGHALGVPAHDARGTGLDALDAVLPFGGWPAAALTEILIPLDGVGELALLWPTLAALTGAGDRIALVAPPYLPYAPAWHAAGIALERLDVIRGDARQALWAAEQCLRAGAYAAVLCWPWRSDDKTLRRLQVAAETGQALGFAFRPHTAAANPSPAALRVAIDAAPHQLRVLKCRGACIPPHPIAYTRH